MGDGLTSFGKMTSKQYLGLSEEDRVRYNREVAECYRDEVILPRGGCGMLMRCTPPATGTYACEEAAGHAGPHRNGQIVQPR